MPNITQLAGMLPRDPQFREWLSTATEVEQLTADEAAAIIRTVCKIDSRRALAIDDAAAKRFHNLLRRPFVEWRSKQH
ncbi:hypothetical protein R69658_05416 [Paraburkholderia aspalathi]|jgi:Zn-dependent M32 family carboxypeptidase|uniref:Uncharacterized protein n=1 Tax=Paraburkholderia aspalathi TaxID=1324617 RepID=A0ABN7MJW4_9BURK|nr:hypothetical protein [Paraburkholderia aspalathi]MBK3821791.1 hypothetical protein [Paraburkholderia aspalathi]MBK3833605.1 hypothetical protein [Paraburkholderia aspalathi]MBK3863328.1 hypothetical protein [Paraburkholderia aspalathi]CAE6811302.1 hypothetical protein R69658_05416 [Paraburkholderia aspalathi]